MRKKLLELAGTIWTAAKNPVGTAVVGGISGAYANHLLNKSKRAQDLEQAQSDCNALEKRVLKLEDSNSTLLTRNDKLRDELRQTDRDDSLIRNELSDYKHRTNTITAAYKNSWCFWRYHIDPSQSLTKPSDKASTDFSGLTK